MPIAIAPGRIRAMGGLHGDLAARRKRRRHADAIFIGPAEQTFRSFSRNFALANAAGLPIGTSGRTLVACLRRSRLIERSRLPGAELHRGDARVPAALRLLLKGRPSSRRSTFYAARGRRDREISRLPGAICISSTIILLGRPKLLQGVVRGMGGKSGFFQGDATSTSSCAAISSRGQRSRDCILFVGSKP